jgi:hypothetical protein
LLQAAPCDLHVYGVPLLIQPAYKSYCNLLPAYLRAYTEQRRVDATQAFLPILFRNEDTFDIGYPTLSISLASPTPQEVLDTLKSFGYQEVTYQKEKVLLFYRPTKECVAYIMSREHNRQCPSPQLTVNTSCLGAISLVKKIFSCFFHTHTYPAFESDEHASEVQALTLVARTGDDRRPRIVDPRPAKKTRTDKGAEPVEDDEDMEEESDDEESPLPKHTIKWALPPPISKSAWGPSDALPAMTGVYVPFIPELASYDSRSVITTITRYFISCLGTSTEDVRANLEFLRGRLAIVSKTPTGNILAHMARCIDIGLQAQARIFPIIEGGVYQGCALLGAKTKYIIGKEIVSPVESGTLMEKVQSFGSHKGALIAILRIAGASEPQIVQGIKDIKTMMALRSVLSRAAINEAGRDEILRLSSQLRFGPYATLNADKIHEALVLISSNDDIPRDYPIHPSMLFERDRTAVIWSTFGESAPSIAFPGKKYALDKNDHPNHIGFRSGIALREAIADLKHVLSTKEVAVPALTRRSAPYVTRIYTGGDSKMLWGDLKRACGVVSTGVAGTALPAVGPNTALFEDF